MVYLKTTIGRRQFGIGCGALAMAAATQRAGARGNASATVILPAAAHGRTIDPRLASLSYETELLADPDFFSSSNEELVAAFRRLNPNGVLRIGGNTADRAVIEGFDRPLPQLHPLHFNKDRLQPYFTVQIRAIDRLRGFLDATGWRVIFGINLRAENAELCAQFRQVLTEKLGDRLMAFQIGNEANNYYANYDEYIAHWKRAQGGDVWPGIAGPDSGANTDWVLRFSSDVPQASLLSRHYYRGPAPEGSLRDILKHDTGFDAECVAMAAAAAKHPHGLWLSEVNSYYYGGLGGVSNAFASTLWGLDFLLSAAGSGVTGICFHGGPRSAIDNSLEGYRTTQAGDGSANVATARRLAAANYSPISGDRKTGFGPTPLFHAMRFGTLFAGSRLFDLDLAVLPPSVRLYAMDGADGIRLIALNNDLTLHHDIVIGNLPSNAATEMLRLSARNPAAFDIDGFPVDRTSAWTAQSWQLPFRGSARTRADGKMTLSLAPCSAAIVRVHR